jgi:hypothetical protein
LASRRRFCAVAVSRTSIPMPTKALPAPIRPIDAWTYSATPYGWVTLLNGSTTVKGRTVDVDVDFNDLM